jgi:serine/threonine-protein kinase
VPVSAASAQAAQTLLPAAYAAAGAEPAYWDSTATSIVTPGNGGPPRRGAPAWPWALLGAVLAAGVIVALVLLLIPARRTVPGVVGKTQVVASETLAADGFTVVPTYETSRVSANTVITQSPGPGSELQKGATVGIVVSSGPGAKAVPDVTGEPVAAAKQQLRAEHFNYTASSQAVTGVKKGYVISTNPIAGSTASPGSVVQLSVSSGPPLQNLAQVTGLQYVNAQSALISQGFKVKKVPVSSSLTPGQVISQTPAGAKAPEGSTVTLDVARAPTTIEVPNVQGLTEASADSTLVTDGFSPTNTTQPVLNPAQNGIVLTQSPAAGSRVKKGTAIILTVASYTAPSTGTSGTTGASGATGTS